MGIAHNPILKGFNPDPSIIRVGDDYYIATSTFEWFPGVQIHHSRDLVNWKVVAQPLNRRSQLDMVGVPDSGGVWAPCLSYSNGTFYLVYTNSLTKDCLKDTHNYLVTCDTINGEWSEPIYINSYGFDPSLFHDTDGRKWFVTMETDFREGHNRFSGILLEEYDETQKKCVGPVKKIFLGSDIGKTEGPHLYHIGDYYYLIVAEGGTELGHAVTVARSKQIDGPYELDPENPMLTSRDKPSAMLQRAGHASIVQAQNGEWFMVHLCGRPIGPDRGYCVLGRETALQSICFDEDGWIRLTDGGNEPFESVKVPFKASMPKPIHKRYTFAPGKPWDMDLQTLRRPLEDDMMSLTARPGYMRLYGKESLLSKFKQTLVARRQQSFVFEALAAVEFEPDYFKQMAGLVYYYNTTQYYYLRISHDENLGKMLAILSCDNGEYSEPFAYVKLPESGKVWLKMEADYEVVRFLYSLDGITFTQYGNDCDALRISDEHIDTSAFTGAFIGICVQDMSGFSKYADFEYFEYIEK